MLGNEQEYLLKDFFIIISALFGLIILVFIQIKNLGFRFRPLGRRKTDLIKLTHLKHDKNDLIYDKNWIYNKNSFEIGLEDYYLVWHISLFKCKKVNLKVKLQKLHGRFWYKFSNSKLKTEKIMAPLFRKIVNKYKNRFESEKSIQFISKNYEDCHLYSWLKNESHIHTAIYSFLDECIYIANELALKPSLLVTLSDSITVEILMPHNEHILLFEKDFKELYAVDFSVDKECVRITLWLAFTQDKIPEICIDGYSKANILASTYPPAA